MRKIQRNYGCRVNTELKSGNLDLTIIENDKIRLSILNGRGADVVECLYKPKDLDLVWLSRHGWPTTGAEFNYLDSLGAFVDYYPGGWQTVFPNAGQPAIIDSAQFSQHGEVSLLPWKAKVIKDDPDIIEVDFICRAKKTPFEITKKIILTVGSAKIHMQETIKNLSSVKVPTMWGIHFTFGQPFLNPGDQIFIEGSPKVIPHATGVGGDSRRVQDIDEFIWPAKNQTDFSIIAEPDTPSEMLYLYDLESPKFTINSKHHNTSISVKWNYDLFPYLWYWMEYGRTKTYPWYGTAYTIGLEPFSSFPTNGLSESISNNSALIFEPFETKTLKIEYCIKDL